MTDEPAVSITLHTRSVAFQVVREALSRYATAERAKLDNWQYDPDASWFRQRDRVERAEELLRKLGETAAEVGT